MIQKLKNIFHFGEAILANIMYGFPGRKLRVIGVTGTDGKTTTVSLIFEILKRAGRHVAMITTVEAVIEGQIYPISFHGTTPSALVIQKFLRQALKSGVTDIVLEVSSHGLDQFRVWGINFEVGVLTNITHEHLDYHRNYEQYVKTKLKLLKKAKTAVINSDDQSFESVRKALVNKKALIYSLTNESADYSLRSFPFETSLFGDFNKQNCLAAITAAKSLAMADDIIRLAIKDFKAPEGREEIVYNKEFTVMIDFAHTPNAIERLLSEVAKIKRGRIIHVFGAPGKRDPTKRPLMGEASSRYAQIIILTADDPRSEKVADINQAIRQGISPEFVLTEAVKELGRGDLTLLFNIPDREQAVRFAIQIAKPGDFVVITGKGHERELYVNNGSIPWNERKIVADAIK